MKSIKYLSYYVQNDNTQKRGYVLAATNKIDYICKALYKIGIKTELISACITSDTKHFYKGSHKAINDMQSLKTHFTFPYGNKIKRGISILSMNLFIFFDLMRLKKKESIIVYHSLGYMKAVNLAHKIKSFNLILEVEEIYSDVIGSKKLRKKELKFLKSVDAYIFPTKLLNETVNVNNKPYTIIHGTYNVELQRERVFNDSKIHVVYAGTFDPRKGGCAAAAAAGEFLSADYHIHILGFGSETETENIKKIITEINKKSESTITYDGLLSGEEYIQFIQSCDIGLSTQNPDADFNATSFPSKILSYMANGLRVVSIRIPAIETADIGEYMYYYNKQMPEEIAKAIKRIDFNDNYNSREVIANLDLRFQEDIRELLKN